MPSFQFQVGTEDLGDRIDTIHSQTTRETIGTHARITHTLLELGGKLPEPIFELLLKQFEGYASAVVSNVPGPIDQIEIAGHEVENVLFWNPMANDQGIGVSIFIYDGTVRIAVSGDANLIPEPQRLTDGFEAEIAELVDAHA